MVDPILENTDKQSQLFGHIYQNTWTLYVPFEVKGLGFLMICNKKCWNFVHGLWVCCSTVHTSCTAHSSSRPIHLSAHLSKARLKKHWYFLSLTRLHSSTVSEWNFVLDSALEGAWKLTYVEWWECTKLSFILFLFYSITSKISGGKKILDTLQKQSGHKLNCSCHFYWYQCMLKPFKALHYIHKYTT